MPSENKEVTLSEVMSLVEKLPPAQRQKLLMTLQREAVDVEVNEGRPSNEVFSEIKELYLARKSSK